jgi:hypothetical protein
MCPECGAVRGIVKETGYDIEDRMLRLLQCQTCGTRYTTVELVVPGSYDQGYRSFYRLAESWRLKNLYQSRRYRGYHNTKQGRYKRPRPRLEIDVRLIEGVRRPERESAA